MTGDFTKSELTDMSIRRVHFYGIRHPPSSQSLGNYCCLTNPFMTHHCNGIVNAASWCVAKLMQHVKPIQLAKSVQVMLVVSYVCNTAPFSRQCRLTMPALDRSFQPLNILFLPFIALRLSRHNFPQSRSSCT